MDMYKQTQKKVDTIINEMTVIKDLVAKIDESKMNKYGFIPGMNMKIETEMIDEAIKKLNDGIFSVVFMSGFAAGKTTLINALVRKDLLKTGINPETAVVTKLVFNADEKVIVYKKNVDQTTGKQLTEEMTVEKFFEKYRVSQDNADMFIDVDYVQLQQSQDGIGGSMVQLVDVPCEWYFCSDSQWEVARNFAEKASAIVYLINAVMPFIYDDKEYIKEHFAGRNMKNLFFVINRFDCVLPGQVDALKAAVENQLKEVYTKKDGSFDRDLFESRVFYTSAWGSLNTRTGQTTPIQGVGEIMIPDEHTGVPAFEEALGKFLTDDDVVRGALSTYIYMLDRIYENAKKRADREIVVYNRDIEKLENEKNENIEFIEKNKKIVNNIFGTATQDILRDIKTVYDTFLYMLNSGWDEHFSKTEFKNLSTADLIKLAFIKSADEIIMLITRIKKEILSYLDEKISEIENELTDIVLKKANKLGMQLGDIYHNESIEIAFLPVFNGKILISFSGTHVLNQLRFLIEEHLSSYINIGIGTKSDKIFNMPETIIINELKQIVIAELERFKDIVMSEEKEKFREICNNFISVVTGNQMGENEYICNEIVNLKKEKERLEKNLNRLIESINEINRTIL